MRSRTALTLASTTTLIAALVGCGGGAECGEAECASLVTAAVAEATSGSSGLVTSEFESSLISPLVEDIRGGVRPWNEQGIGICRGERTCDEYLGSDVGELPEGKYIVMGEFKVPNIGELGTWKINFATQCTISRVSANGTETTSTSDSAREYDVRFAGTERGYRLMPLRTITSPSSGGKRECTYTITAPHPDGDKVYTGSWSTPEEPA